MTFDIDCRGTTRRVTIERAEGTRFTVTVDGQVHHVDAIRMPEGVVSTLDVESGRSREIAFTPGAAGEWLAWFEGLTVDVVVDGRQRRGSGADAGQGPSGEQRLTAPMPGRVVRVLVALGDVVTARQPCVVVEAMKMENELRAPKAGTVTAVAVQAGTAVEAGRVLVVIE